MPSTTLLSRRSLLLPCLLAACALAACGNSNNGDGGTDSGADAPPVTPPLRLEDLSPANIPRICAMHQSCGGLPGGVFRAGTTAAVCVTTVQEAAGRGMDRESLFAMDCAVRSASCDALRRCLGRGRDPAAYCAAHPGLSCDGTTFVDCGAAPNIRTVECTNMGGQCLTVGAVSGCVGATACDAMSMTPPACAGTRVETCIDPLLRVASVDCATAFTNWECAMVPGRPPAPSFGRCEPRGASCMGATGRCDGTAAIRCDESVNREVRYDCAGLYEGTCSPDGGSARCAPTATMCDGNSPDFCAGNSLSMCINGHYAMVPCQAMGLRGCAVTADGIGRCSE
jgi:hypothetical protein